MRTRRVGLGLIVMLALGAAVLPVTQASASPMLTADYQFQNTHASSVGTPPALTDLGPGTNAFASETVDGQSRSVLTFPQDNGVQLSPTTGVVPSSTYTLVALFRFDFITGYRRIFDFKNGTSDSGLYQLNGVLDFYPAAAGSSTSIAAGTYTQVALTHDSAGMVTGYVDGVQQFSFDDSASQYGVIDASNTLRFFRDNDTGGATGEDSSGAVARIDLYDDALSAAQVAALGRLPTNIPAIDIHPGTGPKGTAVVVHGVNFAPGATVVVKYKTGLASPKSVVLCPGATPGAGGVFSCSATIPSGSGHGPKGSHKIAAKSTTPLAKAHTTFILT